MTRLNDRKFNQRMTGERFSGGCAFNKGWHGMYVAGRWVRCNKCRGAFVDQNLGIHTNKIKSDGAYYKSIGRYRKRFIPVWKD